QHPFAIHRKATLLQLVGDPAVAIASPVLQDNALHLRSQLHILLHPIALLQLPIKSRPAYSCQPAHALDTQAALHRHHLPDLLVDAVTPVFSFFWRRAAILCKAPLKKSTSRIFSASSCLTSRNCCCKLSFSSSLGVKFSLIASGCHFESNCRRQPYSRSRGTPNSLARLLILPATFIRSTAYRLNSSVYCPFFLFFCTVQPLTAKCNGSHCLNFGVQSSCRFCHEIKRRTSNIFLA